MLFTLTTITKKKIILEAAFNNNKKNYWLYITKKQYKKIFFLKIGTFISDFIVFKIVIEWIEEEITKGNKKKQIFFLRDRVYLLE